MAGREPEWFRPEPFSREVLDFAFKELGEILPETAEDLNRYPEEFREAVRTVEDLNSYPEEFREAVQTVGRAVITLQLIMRIKLRPLFIESMNLIVDVVHRNVRKEIFKFMDQGYIGGDIFKRTLSCFAILAELILFLSEFGIPIPSYWFPMPWCAIYEHRLRRELESNGGWERLLEVTRRRYIDNGFYRATYRSYRNNTPIPHAEVRGRRNWPRNPSVFLNLRFNRIPRSSTLAMKILKEIYRESLTPTPGAGAYAMRSMLGLPPREEDDWV